MRSSCLQDVERIRAALKRREELLRNKDVPRQSELYKSLGNSLGSVVIENMTLLSKEVMGVTDPLKGPSDNLWLPPSNRIKKKLCLTPPSPVEVTKAFCHQGILGEYAKLGIFVHFKQLFTIFCSLLCRNWRRIWSKGRGALFRKNQESGRWSCGFWKVNRYQFWILRSYQGSSVGLEENWILRN